jgi:hypothetical protein
VLKSYPPQYLGQDEAIRRWANPLTRYLNNVILDLYKLSERSPAIKHFTITASGRSLVGNLGYKPSSVILFARDASIDSFSVGIDNGTDHHCVYGFLNGSNISQSESSASYSAYLKNNAGSNVYGAYVSEINNGGLIITSAVTGTISADLKVLVFP